jgi:hypothetical protein
MIYTAARPYEGIVGAVVPNEKFDGLKARSGEGILRIADLEAVFVSKAGDE